MSLTEDQVRAIVREELAAHDRAFAESLRADLRGQRMALSVTCRCDVLGTDGQRHVNPDCSHCGGTGHVEVSALTTSYDVAPDHVPTRR